MEQHGIKISPPTPLESVTIPQDYPAGSFKELVKAAYPIETAMTLASQEEINEVLSRLKKKLPPAQVPNEKEVAWRISWMKRWRGHITYPLRGTD